MLHARGAGGLNEDPIKEMAAMSYITRNGPPPFVLRVHSVWEDANYWCVHRVRCAAEGSVDVYTRKGVYF
jgi:hypothetical protein